MRARSKEEVEEKDPRSGWGGELGLKGVGFSPQLTVRMQMVSVAQNAAASDHPFDRGERRGRESPTGWPDNLPGSRARTPLV